jgi:transposase
MLGGAMYTTIKTLWEKGISKRRISRITGHNFRTVAKIIEQIKQGKEYPIKAKYASKLDEHKEEIKKYLEKGLTGIRIHEELIDKGLEIGYGAVRNYIKRIKEKEKICIRFQTKQGEESQVDFGYVGLIKNEIGEKKKAYVFNMRLSYSRLDYYEIVQDQKVETFIRCHEKAFEYYKGVPEYIKIDNLKAAILEAHFYEPIYQEMYKKFAQYYGFKPIPCRVCEPQEKGKVESGIKYVKNSFFLGRKFENINEANKQLKKWLEKKCNERVHGTTREKPRDLFEREEQKILKKLPIERYRNPEVGKRLVYTDCHVYIKYNYYSVPYEYVGKEVEIEIENNLVKIFYEYKEIAVHSLIIEKGKFSTKKSHYPKYKNHLGTEYQESYAVKMGKIGGNALAFFNATVEKNPVAWNRIISGILSLTKKYKSEIVEAACKRALYYQALQYSMVKNICENGSYNLPTPDFVYLNEYKTKEVTI